MASLLYTIQNSIATITFNRPEKFNAFNREMSLSLQDALDDCERNNDVRVIVITGAGKAFSSGQDINEIITSEKRGIQNAIKEYYNPVVKKIRNIKKPIIAGVNGIAAGAGANIALCCDVVIASRSASFIQAFGKIGLIPDCGGTYFLPRLIGFQKASALMLLGDTINAEEAERIGMIYKFYDDANFNEEVNKVAMQLEKMAPNAIAYTKDALNKSLHQSLEMQLETEDDLQHKAASTKDFVEGITAFIGKRKPLFTGE